MLPGERFKGYVDKTFSGWADRLATWGMGVLGRGMTKALEDQEPGIINQVRDNIQQIIDNPDIPAITRTMLEKSLVRGDIFAVVMGWILSVIGLIPALFALGGPIGNILNHAQELALRSQILDPAQVITAWRRDPAKYAMFLEDLKYAGWTDERIEALKFVTLFYPPPADLVRWQAREVFEPSMIEKYGLDSELGEVEREPFYRAGMTDEQIVNFWRAHWEHASWMQVVEMLHRGLITEQDVWDWFRVVEIPPYWRQHLIDSAYTWPTRVDVRRWWDMRTIDEPRLRELYSGMGYRGKNLDDYVLWTKVYVAFPDLMARWTKGWITIDEVRSELTTLGMPAERVEEMIQQRVKAVQAAQVDEPRKVTQTAIIRWVKEDIEARWEQGVDLLMDIGFDEAGARFTLNAYIELEGSPETFEDWKAITQRYKIAVGREAKPMPEELISAADEVVRVTKEIEALERSIKDEEAGLLEEEALPEETTARLDELRVSLHRAEAELSRVKSEYDRLVAEWKHGSP